MGSSSAGKPTTLSSGESHCVSRCNDARALQHANRDQHRDQIRDGALRRAPSLLRAFHELLIDTDPAQCRIEREKREQERNREHRNCHQRADAERLPRKLLRRRRRRPTQVKGAKPFVNRAGKDEKNEHRGKGR